MPKVSKQSATRGGDHGVVVEQTDSFDVYTVNVVEFRENIDHTPLLAGLVDNRCQGPHWGYVFKGRMTWLYADREGTYEAGEVFCAPPGHVPVHNEPGTA